MREEFIMKTGPFYVIFCKATGDRYPYITETGFALVYTKREYVQQVLPDKEKFGWKKYSGEEFRKYLKTWYSFGATKFKLDCRQGQEGLTVNRDDLFPDEPVKGWGYYGSNLQWVLLRVLQAQALARVVPLLGAFFPLFSSSAEQQMKQELYMLPMSYGGEDRDAVTPDYFIHTTAGAYRRLEELKKEGIQDIKLYGGEKFKIAMNGNGKIMKPYAAVTNNRIFVPIFTDITVLQNMYNIRNGYRIGMFTFEEIKELAAPYQGIVIDPSGINYVIDKSC
jgi:hypothetical protein